MATGNVAGYTTVDLQLSAGLMKNALTVKVGGTNLLNQYYYSFIGGLGIGGFYYTGLTYGLICSGIN